MAQFFGIAAIALILFAFPGCLVYVAVYAKSSEDQKLWRQVTAFVIVVLSLIVALVIGSPFVWARL